MSAEIITLSIEVAFSLLLLDELDLIGDPVFLNVGGLLIDFFDLLFDVVTVVFDGADELITVASALQIGTLTVKPVHGERLLLDPQEARLDVLFDLLNVVLFLLKLLDQVLELLLEHLVLCRCVQVIKANSRDLIGEVFDFDLFLRDGLIGDLGLLEEVGRGLLDGLLLGGVRDDIVTDGLGLGVELHD